MFRREILTPQAWVSAPNLDPPEVLSDGSLRVADSMPSFEAVVPHDPDLLAAQFQSSVGPEGRVGTREQFADLGIPIYVSPANCGTGTRANGDSSRGALYSNDFLYQEVLYWFSSAELAGDAWVAGRPGALAYIDATLGPKNVVVTGEEWPLVGWETIAAADPTVIVIGTMDRRARPAGGPEVKRAFLTSDPVVRELSAVKRAGSSRCMLRR